MHKKANPIPHHEAPFSPEGFRLTEEKHASLTQDQEKDALAHAARAAANIAAELLARMAAASRAQFPAAAWLKRYDAPQPPAELLKKKRKNKRRRK